MKVPLAELKSFLSRILQEKQQEVAYKKQRIPLEALRARIAAAKKPLDFLGALRRPGIQLIAEVKKASPSKGLLCPNFDPIRLAKAYADNGAAAISVLTDAPYFQGCLDHLLTIKAALGEGCPPLLRKDFIIDPYQVFEARAYAADALLLIVAALDDARLGELLAQAWSLGMEALVEVHTKEELTRALDCGARVMGINNRDLHTFEISLKTTYTLRPLAPPGLVTVSESGIETRRDIEGLEKLGINAVLIGESLVKAQDPGAKIREIFPLLSPRGRRG